MANKKARNDRRKVQAREHLIELVRLLFPGLDLCSLENYHRVRLYQDSEVTFNDSLPDGLGPNRASKRQRM